MSQYIYTYLLTLTLSPSSLTYPNPQSSSFPATLLWQAARLASPTDLLVLAPPHVIPCPNMAQVLHHTLAPSPEQRISRADPGVVVAPILSHLGGSPLLSKASATGLIRKQLLSSREGDIAATSTSTSTSLPTSSADTNPNSSASSPLSTTTSRSGYSSPITLSPPIHPRWPLRDTSLLARWANRSRMDFAARLSDLLGRGSGVRGAGEGCEKGVRVVVAGRGATLPTLDARFGPRVDMAAADVHVRVLARGSTVTVSASTLATYLEEHGGRTEVGVATTRKNSSTSTITCALSSTPSREGESHGDPLERAVLSYFLHGQRFLLGGRF